MIQMSEVVGSSNVKAIGYDPVGLTLRVEFLSGGIYDYENISHLLHEELMAAPSKGKFISQRIRGHYQCHKIN